MPRRSTARTIVGLTAACVLLAAGFALGAPPESALDFSPTPGVACGPNDLPETTQGRVPAADYTSGRADLGYTCNASEVSHVGDADGSTGGRGGYRVHRYTDTAGRTCAYYDTTLLFPVNARAGGTELTGVWVMDMTDPANPIHTTSLLTPAMQSPHESLSLNTARGLLGAVFSNPAFYHGQFDLYDLTADCRFPALRSTLPMGILGHEGEFAPDGNTYYASSLYGHTVAAIDTTNTLAPTTLWTSAKWNMHGFNLSDDGNLLYFADLGRSNAAFLGEAGGTATKGLTVLDVSQIQARVLNPQVSIVSHITWPHISTPQTNLPVTIGGVPHLVSVDEFGSGDNVGAARIINIADPAAPYVVSNMRLAVNNAANQAGPQRQDPGAANTLGGYAGHYCQVSSKMNPKLVACSFILSGLRVFDISDIEHPVEIAYFNQPSTVVAPGIASYAPQGSYAMSQPAFDNARKQIWYSDGNSGLYVVQIDPALWP